MTIRRSQNRRTSFARIVFPLLMLATISGCGLVRGGKPEIPPPDSSVPSSEQGLPELSAPATTGYRIGSGDLLNILVYGEPDLTTVARVDKEGFIEFPLIGRVRASGRTPDELRQRIESQLKAGFLVNPHVHIILQEYRQDMVHLIGQVATPGPYRITHGNTLMETISKAGGFTPIAKRKKVKIIRRQNGGSKVFIVDTTRITDEGRLEEDVLLKPGDVIIVPERFF